MEGAGYSHSHPQTYTPKDRGVGQMIAGGPDPPEESPSSTGQGAG